MAAQKNMRTAHSLQERKRTTDVLSSENINVDFASLLLSEAVQKGLTAAGFERPSPIQLKAIPLGRCGLDLIVQAKSGTGKTCVFSVIALESIITTTSSLQVLVLAPTREIAVQIQNVIQAIGIAMEGLKCHTFIGGTIFGQDRQHLKKCHIAVGTPGRIKQLIEYEVLKTDSVRMFVLDEADKLLDEKFQASVNWIYHQLPENKQMLALSATYPESLAQQLTNYMRDPTFVRLNPRDLTLQGIKQFYKIVPGHQLPHKSFQIKADHLVTLLSQVAFNQCLIFSNFQSRAHNLCELLVEKGWPATYISGNQEQADRMKAMAELKAYKCRILISTDLTSRGIDAENVNLIINLDVPMDFKTYLHRIGRAGRFGTHGAAVTLASQGQEVNLLKTVKKRSGSDIRLLPDPVPSNLLKMSAAQMQTEVLEPTDMIGPPEEDEVSIGNDTSQPEKDENSDQSFALKGGTKQQMNYPQTMRDGEVDGEVNDGMATNGYSPAEDRYHLMTSEKENLVSSLDRGATARNETIHHELEKEVFERPGGNVQRNGSGMLPEDGGNRFQARERANHRWMVDLKEWVLPIMVMQEVKKTSRKRWTWEEAVREFENKRQLYKGGKVSLEATGISPILESGDASCRDDSKRDSFKEDGVEGLEATAGFGKDQNVETFVKVDKISDPPENGHEINAEDTEKVLKNSDVFVEFQAMKVLLEQCKIENSTLEGAVDIAGSAQPELRSDKTKYQQKTVSESSKGGGNNSHKNLHYKDKTKEEDSVEEELFRDFKLDEKGLQNESLGAGGDSKYIGGHYESNCGIGFNGGIAPSVGIGQETCDLDDVSSLGRTSGSVNDNRLIKSTSSLGENRLYDQHSCEMKLNHNGKKLKKSSKEDWKLQTSETYSHGHLKETFPSLSFEHSSDGETKGVAQNLDWKHVAGCHGNISKENTSDKVWEYFKQYIKEDSMKSSSSRKLDRTDERTVNNAFANSTESDSDSSSFSSKSERVLENEQNLLDSKMSDISTGSVKLNGCDSSLKSDGGRKLPRKGKPRNISKGQDFNWDAWYSHYPYYNSSEWNEAASCYGEGSYFEGWDNSVHPSDNTRWGLGYGEMVHPHCYWDAYFNNY